MLDVVCYSIVKYVIKWFSRGGSIPFDYGGLVACVVFDAIRVFDICKVWFFVRGGSIQLCVGSILMFV